VENQLKKIINTSKAKAKNATAWFNKMIDKTIKGKSEYKTTTTPEIGVIHNFVYDAKHKDKLPTWDAFPISIPIEFYNDGWLGINLHYLPLRERMQLLKALEKVKKTTRNKNTRFKLSYKILQAVAKTKLYEPTLHRYLTKHIKTKYNVIELDDDYSNIIHLPPAQWQGKKPY
jgi:hypothetical protein